MAEIDPNTADAGWVSVSELARLKGLSKAAVSERVARFIKGGQLSTKPGKGKVKLVNLAAFDRVAGETTDLAKATGHATRKGQTTAGTPALTLPPGADPLAPIYTAEQARDMAYRAEMRRMDLEERLGKLVTIAEVEQAITAAAEALVRVIDQMPLLADDIAAAVAQSGAAGARTLLKAKARETRETAARELAAVLTLKRTEASQAPADPPEEPPPEA
ncbi:putative coiled-coil protein SlyX [Bosea sp. OAE506]|uniref:hypothetical protein n=1 Tax=Bosea sp. OAE506 TaxID=2663870 RepID=UPI0017897703